jgi:hypothetical protein
LSGTSLLCQTTSLPRLTTNIAASCIHSGNSRTHVERAPLRMTGPPSTSISREHLLACFRHVSNINMDCLHSLQYCLRFLGEKA